MIIDAHAHATAPDELYTFNHRLLNSRARFRGMSRLQLSDERIATTMRAHLTEIDAGGTDVQLISPRPWAVPTSHPEEATIREMALAANDVIARTVPLFPDRFRGIGALPQCAGISPANCLEDLQRCVTELGFVGCKI